MDTAFIDDIKYNCDVSDAKYWGYFSICGLLMRYRDLYRSEKGLKPWADIPRDEITGWISRKELQWPELGKHGFKDLTIENRKYDPFDAYAINRALNGRGLVYGAGYGIYMKPTFFLAELQTIGEVSDHAVYAANREIVRDLFTAPAMLQGRCIFLRIEPLTVMLWEKYAGADGKPGSAVADAFSRSGLQAGQGAGDAFETKLADMAKRYADTLLYHELAESLEDVPEWRDILMKAGDRNVELYLRALKDLIADTSDRGPYKRIIDRRDRPALSLSIAIMEGHRKALYPEMKEAYEKFLRHEDWDAIEEARLKGYERFSLQREKVLKLYRNSRGKEDFVVSLKRIIR